MDHARCTCDRRVAFATFVVVKVDTSCPFHGTSNPDPYIPWELSDVDRKLLKVARIGAK